MKENYLEKIQNSRVYGLAKETSLDFAANLSRRLNVNIWLKREDEQAVFSFKLRGSYNKMAHLSPAALKKGVVAASAGNHAQGVALAAKHLGAHAIIVMPITAAQIKIDAVRSHAAEVILEGDNFDAAYQYARTLCTARGLTFIHAYDDPDVIAGQGTVALEILKQRPQQIDAIFVPIGGGGLIAGIASYVKAVRPEIKIIGVEPNDADAMYRSIKAGKRIVLDHVGLFADGVAIRQVGEITFSLVQQYVDDIILVSNDEICAAIKDIFEDTRSIMEPSGALAVAGIKKYRQGNTRLSGQEWVAITSGANMNFDRLRHVSERAEIGERREAILAVTIPEKVGSFRQFCSLLGSHSITEFNYRYSGTAKAHIFVGLQIQSGGKDIAKLVADLIQQGYETLDMTDNEMAKLHIRHLVGGRAPNALHEILYRFEFPERPGALMNFLNKMGQTWNISLFHYRNHGTDFGRVLVGMQVPPQEKADFESFLASLGYEYAEETCNPAYKLFLS